MEKILIAGGGWAGCAAAVAAAKQGAEVTLLEKTDLLLGAGNVGGIMRNNGRFTAAEENMAMGAAELFEITDRHAVHRNVDFPGHRHASFYDAQLVEPAVRRLLKEWGVKIFFCTRAVDVKWETCEAEATLKKVLAVEVMENSRARWLEGDCFVEATGSSGPMGNCMRYGKGCAMCIQRCPAFGPRVSLTARAGAADLSARRRSASEGSWEGAGPDKLGALSGSCKLEKRSLSAEIQQALSQDGFAVIPLPAALIRKGKLAEKVCQQYALDSFAENLVLIDTGEAKLMTSYFNLEELQTVPGFENARYLDPCAGGRGNSVRYMSVGQVEGTMKARGFFNLFLGGEKSGFFVGHTEAITTGSLAGYNAARAAAWEPDGNGPGLLVLPRSLATGELIAAAGEALRDEDGLYRRFTFAGGEFFGKMKERGLYSTDREEICRRVEREGLGGIYNGKEAEAIRGLANTPGFMIE